MNVEIDRDVALKLGIVYADDESQYKKLNLINKDSIVIRRSISLGDLKKILINLNKLEKKPDNFALNYLVPAKKYRYKNSELVESLVENLLVKNFSNFLLVGDEYEKYVVNSDIYRILSADEKVFLKQETPITISDIFEELEKRNSRISKSLIYEILKKWKVETLDHLGNYLLQPTKLIDTLQGFIEFGYTNELIYLINGEWYIFDKNYSKLLNQEYEELFDHKKQIELQLLSSFPLKVKANDEESYNKSLKMNKKIIFADRNLIEYIEIADAIYWDDGNLFLMHNKMSFNGSGARDLANQILSAAELLKNNNNRYNRTFLEQYYLKLCKEYNTTELIQISKSGFIDMFASKKIWYVAGFVKDFKKKSKSNYAKYLMIELNKKLKEKDFDFIPFGIS